MDTHGHLCESCRHASFGHFLIFEKINKHLLETGVFTANQMSTDYLKPAQNIDIDTKLNIKFCYIDL